MDAVTKFRQEFLSSDFIREETDDMITYFDKNFKIIYNKRRIPKVIVIDKRFQKEIIYNSIDIAKGIIQKNV